MDNAMLTSFFFQPNPQFNLSIPFDLMKLLFKLQFYKIGAYL